MSFTDAVKTCLTEKYCCFSGRARRSEYWYYCLFNFAVSLVVSLIANLLFEPQSTGYLLITALVSLALFLPGLGVAVRRLHDTGKSGWYYLMALIPLVGVILLLVKFCTDSQPGENRFGANPKEPAAVNAYNDFDSNF